MDTWYSKIEKLFEKAELKALDEHSVLINKHIKLERDLWESRQAQVISRLDSILNQTVTSIFARNTNVVELDKNQAKQFIDDNHLMGFGGGKTFLGLRDDTEIVAVAAFSKILFMKYENPPYYSVELERYCSLMGTTVTGGLDKLIKGYLNEYEVDDVVTYIDKQWSKGKAFEKIGFEKVGETEPLHFVVNTENWSRKQLKKSRPLQGSHEYLIKNDGNIKMRLKIS